VLGDRLAPAQLVGAALVVGAIALLQVPNSALARLIRPVSGLRGRMLVGREARRLAAEAA
jgi:hypothetical protein